MLNLYQKKNSKKKINLINDQNILPIFNNFRIIKYLFSDKKRYSDILLQVIKNRPKNILEIGIYKKDQRKLYKQQKYLIISSILWF